MLERTDLLSLNVEEAQSWVGDNGRDPELLCRHLMKLGPKAIALTDGRKGAYSYSKEGFYYIEAYPGPLIEATGAGDAFTTAYIAALARGLPHSEALRWGPINAGFVVQKVGPQAGLLTKREMDAHLKRMKKFQVMEIKSKSKMELMNVSVEVKKINYPIIRESSLKKFVILAPLANSWRINMKAIKLGINGFGRIGRQAFKVALENPEVEVAGLTI